jgi:hypothetical protein
MPKQQGPVDPNTANNFAQGLDQPANWNNVVPDWLLNLMKGKQDKDSAFQQAPQVVPTMVQNSQPNLAAQKAALQQIRNGG